MFPRIPSALAVGVVKKIIKHGAKLRHIRYILIVLKSEKGAASRCGNINFGCDVDPRGRGGSNISSKPLA